MMALSAARAFPDGVRWLYASTRVGATRSGQIFAAALLDHYNTTLVDMRRAGYSRYAATQLRPYARAALSQFSPGRQTLTQRTIEKVSDLLRRLR
jgi:hypothetical protein